MQQTAPRRNDPCPCGSGRRYKECHGALPGAGSESLAALARALEVGDSHRRRGEHTAAIAAYEAVLAAGRRHPVLLNNLGLAYQGLGRLEEAAARYREALELAPDLIEANANLGDALRMLHRHREAAERYTRALALDPSVAMLWSSLGLCQHALGALDEARASFARALALKPDDALALINVAAVLIAERHFAEAAPLAERALALQPESGEASNLLLYVRQQLCDWRDLGALIEKQRASLTRASAPPVAPHSLFALPYAPAELLAAARKWSASRLGPIATRTASVPESVSGKRRIAYLGPDFRSHPLASLLSEVIERHDRSRFEVIGYSLGPDDRSPARARFAAAFDRFVDVRTESPQETARRIQADGVAILLDTSGYVIHARPEIFALRPAPIQVNCIGFPGTLGADCYDYILADRFVTPPGQQKNFAERLMILPHCYLPGDSRRVIASPPTRAGCGLPEQGLVFCCFNGGYKITPRVFEVWMRLLQAVPDSVLWLLEPGPAAAENLRGEARRRSVAPERLVFAARLPLDEHLARHAAADLFLDTFPCNAHTTANDALFAGLPLLTCAGETFASRVSGSQLMAIGLPELVTDTIEAYEAKALQLAHEPRLLAAYRDRLQANRRTHPLFDTAAYTQALEDAFLSAVAELSATPQLRPR
jgi:protein O-GlcNAc transferase